ncbi:MAG: glycosyltransferase family 2 protein, partial [Bacteroidales bacterium]|nr:glycosyltransferase family 2 protein [Bacteroidales bacterium]
MTNPKVSVIIPVYNTVNYLESSVSSIQEQTLRDIEILIIDDGSTDNSPAILKKLSESDARIRLFTQSNQGQSAARNLGLDNAQGDYVYFMDSDDILELNTLSSCYEKCDSQNLDIVIFDADVFYES